MGYQPWYVGQTYPAWQIPLNVETLPDNITGVDLTTFTMTFRNTNSQNISTDVAGTGQFFLVTASPAVVSYKPSPSDVANPFSGTLIVKATFPGSNGGEAVWDPITFAITAD